MTADTDASSGAHTRGERDLLLESARELFELLLVEETLEHTVERIADLTCRTVIGCAHASVTRPGADGPYTAVSTSKIAFEIDEAQYAANSGPCLDALHSQQPIRVRPMSAPGDYEQFRAAAVERGVLSSLSLPLAVRDLKVGALNLYSEDEEGFDTIGDELGTEYAAQVAVAISCAELHNQTREIVVQLEEALSSRDVIGQAKGILMATERMSAQEAFALLRRASQNANRKLRDIAEVVVATGRIPESREPDR